MAQEKKLPEHYSIARPPTFRKQYATNVFVMMTDTDFRVEVFNEKFKTENSWVYRSEEILTREAAKKIVQAVRRKIGQYEKEYSEIQEAKRGCNSTMSYNIAIIWQIFKSKSLAIFPNN